VEIVMVRSIVARFCLLTCLVVPLSAQSPASKIDPALYSHVATLPDRIGGQNLSTFAFDRAAHRLYAGSWLGLYWVDLTDEHPVWKGPMFKANILHVEFGPEVRRLFYMTLDEVGYVSADALETPHTIASVRAHDIVYEPTRQELYEAYRAPRVQVFSATSGERSGAIELPSWYAQSLEAIPGRVFLTLPTRSGLYAVDAASHHVGAWPVDGKIVTPVTLEADPAGRYLFATYYQNLVAIDTATAKVVGRISSGATPAIAFDPGSNLLITTFPYSEPPFHVAAYRVDSNGFTQVGSMENPAIGGRGVEPTSDGFIQKGEFSFLVWALSPTRRP
jgi:hypothetical protein